MRQVRFGGERGSALVITVVMLLLMIAFTSVLVGAPTAHLTKVGSATARERAVATADAGLRDCLQFLGQNTSLAEIANSTGYTSPNESMTPASGTSSFAANSFYPQSNTTGAVIKYWDGNSYHDTDPGGTTAYPYIQKNFGGGKGRFAWRVLRRDSSYLQITSLGLADGGGGNASTYAIVEAVVRKDQYTAAVPGASSFVDPTGAGFTDVKTGGTSTSIYNTWTGGTPTSSNGADTSGGGDIAGVAIQNTGVGYGAGSTTVAGSPPIVGGTSGNAGPSAATWASLVAVANAAKTNNTDSLTYSGSAFLGGNGGSSAQLVYINVPAGTTIAGPPNGSPFRINGNSNWVRGLVVIDLEDNVTLPDSSYLYDKNGTSGVQGAIIVIQRGRLNVGQAGSVSTGLHYAHKSGNNSDYIKYNSAAIAEALQNLSSKYKIASYIIR